MQRELQTLIAHAAKPDPEAIRADLARLIPENKFGQLR